MDAEIESEWQTINSVCQSGEIYTWDDWVDSGTPDITRYYM